MNLINFYSQYKKHKITLHWSTASECENEHFTVERSVDGQNWSEMGSIGGEGKKDIIQSYSMIDEHPYFGTSYYRLRRRIKDDQFEWFTPLTAICNNVEEASMIKCYPHPFDSELKIRFHKCINKPTSIEISNMMGVVVYKDLLNKYKLNSKKCVLDLSAFPSGSYMVRFISDSNAKTLKLITKR